MSDAQSHLMNDRQSGNAPTVSPLSDEVLRSMRHCHQVTRERARNFYYGLKLTPEPRRSAGYAIYAFMRACDDLVDMPVDGRHEPPPPEVGLARIEEFRGRMQAVLDGKQLPEGPMWPAFRYVLRTYSIDPADLHAMLDGQRCDLIKTRYETFDELYDYCYKVASVVGLVCIRIWGAPSDPAVLKMAEQRGVALQLTNILRDVVEDARRGRVYLPAEELKRFGCDAEALISGKANEAFDRLMAFQIERAKGYYQMSAGLEPHLDASCRPTSWALMEIYRRLLNKIASNPRRVLTQRVRLSSFQKAMIGLRATMGWFDNGT